MSNVWNLLVDGKFIEACNEADVEYKNTGSEFPLRNKVFALLNLEKYEETSNLCKKIIELRNGETDSDFIFLGVARWLLGRHQEAIDAWNASCKCKYTDAAGGVDVPLLLYSASISLRSLDLRNESLRQLKKIVKHPEISNWPGPLAQYILGTIKEEQLFKSVSAQTSLRVRQLCQVNYYMGMVMLMDGNKSYFLSRMKEACSQHGVAILIPEFYLARANCGDTVSQPAPDGKAK
jgi:lipoprotein NlpI